MDAGPPGSPLVRAVHLSPGAPSVDVFVDDADEALITDLAFTDGSEYVEVPAGVRDLDFAPADGTAEESVLELADLELEPGVQYTVAAFGMPPELEGVSFVDDPRGLPEDQVRLRAIHTATGIDEVDVWDVTDPGAPRVLFEDVSFGEAGQPIDLPARERVEVGLDTDDDGLMELVFELPGLQGGAAVNVFAATDSTGAFLLLQPPTGSTSRIDPLAPGGFLRIMHAAPAAPTVDVLVNGLGEGITEELAFRDSSPFLTLAPGTYEVTVLPEGGTPDDAVASLDGVALEDGGFVTVVAYDTPGGGVGLLALTEDYGSLPPDDARLRAVHTAPAFGPIDLLDVQEPGPATLLYDDLGFGSAGRPVDVPGGTRVLGLDDDGDLMPEQTFSFVAPGGTFTNVHVVNRPDSRSRVFLLLQRRGGTVIPVSRN